MMHDIPKKAACIDLEGVLVPELWPLIAQITGIEDLAITTREEPDYAELMQRRIALLRTNDIPVKALQTIVSDIAPFPESIEFLQRLSSEFKIHVLSDCFQELAAPLLHKLGSPQAYCHSFEIDHAGWATGCRWAPRRGKEDHVARLLSQSIPVLAVGDAFNDLAMLRLATDGFLVRPSAATRAVAEDLRQVEHLSEILMQIGIPMSP